MIDLTSVMDAYLHGDQSRHILDINPKVKLVVSRFTNSMEVWRFTQHDNGSWHPIKLDRLPIWDIGSIIRIINEEIND